MHISSSVWKTTSEKVTLWCDVTSWLGEQGFMIMDDGQVHECYEWSRMYGSGLWVIGGCERKGLEYIVFSKS